MVVKGLVGLKRTVPAALFSLLFLLSCGLLLSCGIETYYYLPRVEDVSTSTNTYATIRLPDSSVIPPYFRNFTLYYRIYISGSNAGVSSYDDVSLRSLNPTLYSDYSALLPYTSTTTVSTANMAVVLGNRGYYPLFFQTGSGYSSDILTTPGAQLSLSFQPSGTILNPYLSPSTYLIRSNGGGAITLTPDRYFRYSGSGHYGTINSTTNTDVVDDTTSGSTKNYAYVSMYIVTTGLNEQTYTPIYSIPTFVGIFMLPL
jgi:hypothetical protein